MNKAYLLAPAVLLGGFVWMQQEAETSRLERHHAHQARLDAAKAAAERERSAQAAKAAEDARLRAEEASRKERTAAEKKLRDAGEALARLTRAADAQAASAAELGAELAQFTARLALARERRTELEQELFAHARAVEEQRVARRNAELEVQRAAKALALRYAETR